MSTITTYTRKHFDPVHPAPELLCVEDFAHALPMICRGNGHVTTFWSVGEHCICCAKEAAARGYSRRLVLACLLHDALSVTCRTCAAIKTGNAAVPRDRGPSAFGDL